MKKLSLRSALLVLAALSGAGCIAQSERDNLLTQYRKCEEQNEELRAKLSEARERIRVLSAAPGGMGSEAELAAARDEVARLQKALSEAEAKIRELASAAPGGPLPRELSDELERLAASNPQLMTYDKERGMVKLASDLTFASGSDKVGAAARDALGRLAGILNSPLASNYEVRIVGHTDNVPIKHSAREHPTNWHLSAHRAIAVKDVLSSAGVAEARASVAGYSEYRPLVPNGPNGARANRRVELFLVQDKYQAISAAPPAGGAEAPAAAPSPAAEPAGEDDGSFK